MEEFLNSFIIEHSEVSGIIIIVLCVIFLFYNLRKENAFNFEDFNFLNWQEFFASWVLNLVLFIIGFKLLFNF